MSREIREREPNRSVEFVIDSEMRVLGDQALLRTALANLVQVRLSAGNICIAAESATHVFADVAGYFV